MRKLDNQNEHRNREQSVDVSQEDGLRRHTLIVGQTGTGRGLAVIDPHGEVVESILGKIPVERAEGSVLNNK